MNKIEFYTKDRKLLKVVLFHDKYVPIPRVGDYLETNGEVLKVVSVYMEYNSYHNTDLHLSYTARIITDIEHE